jgi:hypothetical protein
MPEAGNSGDNDPKSLEFVPGGRFREAFGTGLDGAGYA